MVPGKPHIYFESGDWYVRYNGGSHTWAYRAALFVRYLRRLTSANDL